MNILPATRVAIALFAFACHSALAAIGDITTFAGGGDGVRPIVPGSPATSIVISQPRAVAVDAGGNFYFVNRGTLYRVTAGNVFPVASGVGTVAAMAMDGGGNFYLADDSAHQVRKVDAGGAVSVIAGTGTAGFGGDGGLATAAQLNAPKGIGIVAGDVLVSDSGNNRVRRISGGNITTVAGDGTAGVGADGVPAVQAGVAAPGGLVEDGAGGFYVVTGTVPGQTPPNGGRIRRVVAGGTISTLVPINVVVPGALARDPATGDLYLAGGILDISVRMITLGGTITTVVNTGPGPFGVALATTGDLYVADSGQNLIVKRPAGGGLTTVAGGGPNPPYIGDGGPATEATFDVAMQVAVKPSGAVLIAQATAGRLRLVDESGIVSTIVGEAPGEAIYGVALDQAGNIYFSTYGTHRIRKMDTAGTVTTFAGTGEVGFSGDGGPAISARLNNPTFLAFDAAGNLYFSERNNRRVRRITPGGIISTIAGNGGQSGGIDGGPATGVGITPEGLVFDAAGNLLVADVLNHRIRRIDTAGNITTFAGNGVAASDGDGGPAISAALRGPSGVAVDPSGNVYIADTANQRIRRVTPSGTIEAFAGTGELGFSGDGGPALAAKFHQPYSVAWDPVRSALLVSDSFNQRVRLVAMADTAPDAFAFAPQAGVTPGSFVQSAPVTPVSYQSATAVLVTGGEYSIGCTGTFTSATGTISPGQSICVRHIASLQNNFVTSTTLTIGGVSAVFSATTVAGAGTLDASPGTLAFDGQSVNTTSLPRTLTLTNTGATTVTVHSAATTGPFAAATSACSSVAPGASCTVQVTFTPTSGASLAGTVSVRASSGNYTANLTGTGEVSLATHYYQSIFRRAPDSAGKAFWEAEAARVNALGADPRETWFAMSTQFYFSPEYVGFARTDAAFVTDLYRTFFNREPDATGLDFWTTRLASVPREAVLADFLFSAEFVAFTNAIFGSASVRAELGFVMNFYRGFLARLPEDSGFNYWLGRFRTAQCAGPNNAPGQVRAVALDLAGQSVVGAEYVGRNRTNAQFVADMYNAFLRRGADPSGMQFWLGRLTTGADTRASMVVGFTSSAEFQQRINQVVAAGCINP